MTQLCSICPRGCGVDRAGGQFGFCAVPDAPVVARAAPHFGEEPCISGTRGSGAVFFSGCNLRCVFCQNRTISRGEHGKEITVAQLGDIFLRLRDEGVHNINLVTPSHYTRQIAEALSGLELGIPVVWNSSGYECVETLRMLDGLVQVYLPDLKYALSGPPRATPPRRTIRRSRAPPFWRCTARPGRSGSTMTACCSVACSSGTSFCHSRGKTPAASSTGSGKRSHPVRCSSAS